MTRKLTYRATISGLTDAEFIDVFNAVTGWANGNPNRSAPIIRRNHDTGETEIQISIASVAEADLLTTLQTLETGANTLPGDNWPSPIEETTIRKQPQS